MDLQLTGKNAIITGGASGIGLATAKMLEEEGASVAVWDVNSQVTEIVDRELRSGFACRCDLRDTESIDKALTVTMQRCSSIDLFVHAAAIGSGKFGFPFTKLTPSDWKAVIDVNIHATVDVADRIARRMQAQASGAMVFISSVAGQIGSQTDPPYSASKAALINFAQCMAKDLAIDGVRVNTVCPGMVQTPLNRNVWKCWHERQAPADRLDYETWGQQKIEALVPLKRWQQTDDIAAMTVFLLSDRCREVTGQTINVDGGQVMHW